jgi:hypothetical protein
MNQNESAPGTRLNIRKSTWARPEQARTFFLPSCARSVPKKSAVNSIDLFDFAGVVIAGLLASCQEEYL